jgi:signal transduction histidine kinase
VQSIVTLMRGVRPVTCTLNIDDRLAAGMTGRERLHLLQITREAVSNSVRHGQAKHLNIRFEQEAEGIVLEVRDDGVGLDNVPSADGGRGLANVSARAKELGGELELRTEPAGGLTLRVVIPVRVS